MTYRPDEIESLNGQQAVIDVVSARWITAKKEIVVATGLPGAGVTWTLERAAEAWEALGGVALQVRGEPFARERRLFPWLTMALPGAKRLARLEVLKSSVSQGSRALPVIGSATSYLVEELLNHRKKRLAREALLLNEQEQDLLFVIQTTAQRKRLLLTIDHLDSWDEASWALFGLVLSPSLDDLYPALAEALILVGASREVPIRLRSVSSRLLVTEFRIRPLERQELPLALSAFRLPVEARDDIDLLYDLTNGRLDLLHDLGMHIRDRDLAGHCSGVGEFYDSMIERRMEDLSGEGHGLEELLAAAAILGQSFAVEDIQCLTGYSTEKLEASLRLALTEHLLSAIGNIARFQSAALHHHFHSVRTVEHAKYHGKFADCLQSMRPGDYEYRLHHLALGGRTDDALTCFALATLAAQRQHRATLEPGDLKKASGWGDVRTYLDAMRTAYGSYYASRLNEALQILDTVESFLPDVLIAERDYLEAQILLKSHRISNYQRAVGLLDRWQDLKSREGEVWARITQVLMIAQVQMDRIDEAHRLEAEVTTHYWNRRKVDPWALYGLNALRRRAESLHHLPAATLRLESAVAYFGPREAKASPRHPTEYYYALTNLVGNLTASGRFGEAYARSLELDEFVHSRPLIPWPALEIAANNYVLAGYLSENLDVRTAVSLMEQIVKESTETGDRILMENNYAVFLIRAGRQADARAVLEHTYAEVTADSEPDGYHRYFVGNNLAALLALAGDTKDAELLNRECSGTFKGFYPAIRETLRRRQELFAVALTEGPRLGLQEFDEFLLNHHTSQIGPQWSFYGRGFLFSDIQFWSTD